MKIPSEVPTGTSVFVSPCSFKCECTCAVSLFGGATPDVGGDRVRGRDRPVPCPRVYWPPRGGSARWHWGAPGISTGGGHSYRGGEETQGRGGLTQHFKGTSTVRREEDAGLGSNSSISLLDLCSLTDLTGESRFSLAVYIISEAQWR